MIMGRAGPLREDIMRVLYVEGSEGVEERPAAQAYLDVGSSYHVSTDFNPRC